MTDRMSCKTENNNKGFEGDREIIETESLKT